MVHTCASTRNESITYRAEGHTSGSRSVPHHNQVWRLDLASSHLETMTSQPDTVPPDPVLLLTLRQSYLVWCLKTAGLVSPGGMRTPFPPGDRNLSPTMTFRGHPQGSSFEVPHPVARVDPDGRVYQAGIRKVHPTAIRTEICCPAPSLRIYISLYW